MPVGNLNLEGYAVVRLELLEVVSKFPAVIKGFVGISLEIKDLDLGFVSPIERVDQPGFIEANVIGSLGFHFDDLTDGGITNFPGFDEVHVREPVGCYFDSILNVFVLESIGLFSPPKGILESLGDRDFECGGGACLVEIRENRAKLRCVLVCLGVGIVGFVFRGLLSPIRGDEDFP